MSTTDRQDWKENRPTPSQRLHEVTMAALARRPAEPEHTVGLTLNAKGDVQIEVTGRGPDLDTLSAAVLAKFEWLREQFPRGNGGPPAKPNPPGMTDEVPF